MGFGGMNSQGTNTKLLRTG